MKHERDWTAFLLRLPADLKKLIDQNAKQEYRSVTSEIVKTLSERYSPNKKNADVHQAVSQ